MSEYDAIDVPPENDLHKLAMQIRYDLTAAQGKLTELMRQIGFLEIENRPTANINGPSRYVPGKLRYLKQVENILKFGGTDGAEERIRVYLEGFTDDEAEITAHLDALRNTGDWVMEGRLTA